MLHHFPVFTGHLNFVLPTQNLSFLDAGILGFGLDWGRTWGFGRGLDRNNCFGGGLTSCSRIETDDSSCHLSRPPSAALALPCLDFGQRNATKPNHIRQTNSAEYSAKIKNINNKFPNVKKTFSSSVKMPNSSKKVKKKGPGAPSPPAEEEVEQRYCFISTVFC